MEQQQRTFVDRRKGDTVFNVVIGAAVAFVVASMVPVFGQALGGGVSGYLQQEGPVPGAKVGGVAGFLSSLPGLAVAGLFVVPFLVLPLLGAGGGSEGLIVFSAFSGFFLLVAIALVVVGLVFSTVMGAAGGYLGAVVFEDSTEGRGELLEA